MSGETAYRFFRQHNLGYFLSLMAIVSLVYIPFLGNPFVFDDRSFFYDGPVDYYIHAFFHFDPRWLPNASLGWTYAIFGDKSTYAFHLGNILLHTGNVLLLFYLLRRLVDIVINSQKKPSVALWGAWLGALIFACHPVGVYAVGYIIQRSILFATFFALVMQLAYLRGLLSGQKRWLILSVVAYFLAGFSKEHSVMLPAVMIAMTILLRAQNKSSKHALWLTWAAFAAIGVLLTIRSQNILATSYEYFSRLRFEQMGITESTPVLHLLSILTQAGLFFKYLLLWILPNPAWMSVDMREPFLLSWRTWQGWLGLVGFIVYGIIAGKLLLRPRWLGLAGLAMLYPWLQFWVEFSSIRVQEPFVLYRSYLWLPGMMVFFPWLLSVLPGRKTWIAMSAVVLVLISFSWNRLWVFADPYRLWNDAALLLPNERVAGADRIFYGRGEAADWARRWDEAIADYQRALAISPQLAPIHYQLGLAYAKTKRDQEAIAQYDIVIAMQPDIPLGYYAKGLSLLRLQQREQALQQLQKSCALGYDQACLLARQM
ncbi:MAG: tetratricopeptide repeat protein [Gallionellaceae bacterium]|nr:tetratricopeptide repeat protein [Gallionellaceae bacterium]